MNDLGPRLVTGEMLLDALGSLVDALGADATNADRHNHGRPGTVTMFVIRELGVDWREIAASESLVDDMDIMLTPGAPLQFTIVARELLDAVDDLGELGWEWGAILDRITDEMPELEAAFAA